MNTASLYTDSWLHKDCLPVGLHSFLRWLSVALYFVEDGVDSMGPVRFPVPRSSGILPPSHESMASVRSYLIVPPGSRRWGLQNLIEGLLSTANRAFASTLYAKSTDTRLLRWKSSRLGLLVVSGNSSGLMVAEERRYWARTASFHVP